MARPSLPAKLDRLANAYDRLATVYDQAYLDPRSRAENAVVRRAVEGARWAAWLADMNEPCQTLDLGCGTGLLLDLVKHEPEEYLGVDLSGEMLRVAQDRHPDFDFWRGSMDSVPWADEDFAVAVSLFALPHLQEPWDALWEARRLLRDGGRLVVTFATHRRLSHVPFDLPMYPVEPEEVIDLVWSAAFKPLRVSGLSAGARDLGPLTSLLVRGERLLVRDLSRFQHVLIEAVAL